MTVPVQIRPNGGVSIEVFFSSHILQYSALSSFENNRFVLRPIAHLRKGMPNIPLI
jgi:hypothetical protein